MEAIRVNTVIQKDGEIRMTGLPVKKGEQVELIVVLQPSSKGKRQIGTARKLRRSSVIGMWEGRTDIEDSAEFARSLRERAQRRS